jgi:hypothetical protein
VRRRHGMMMPVFDDFFERLSRTGALRCLGRQRRGD